MTSGITRSYIIQDDSEPKVRIKVKVKGKGKVIPEFFNWAPRHEGVLGKWKYSSTYSLTAALDGGNLC